MIFEMTASTLLAYSNPTTGGSSKAAEYIAKEARQDRERLYRSSALGTVMNAITQQLCELAEARSDDNWDGYGADALDQSTFRQAYIFAEALPPGIAVPHVGAEPDGSICFEWYKNPRRTLSVSVTADAELHYAALLGASRAYGSEVFLGSVPSRILELAQSVTA